MIRGLQGIELTDSAREIIGLASRCGLRPHVAAGGNGRGLSRVVIDSRTPDGLFGTIDIDRDDGRVVCGYMVHGNWAEERRYDGADQVRNVIASWAALTGNLA